MQSALRTVTVPLSKPVDWFDKLISVVTIQEPSAATFFEMGSPQIVVHNGVGGGSLVDVPVVLSGYLEKCLKVEQPGPFLRLLPLADGRALKAVILGFFQDAPEETSS